MSSHKISYDEISEFLKSNPRILLAQDGEHKKLDIDWTGTIWLKVPSARLIISFDNLNTAVNQYNKY